MIIKVWTGADFVPTDVPDDLLRPLVERLLTQRDWDRNLDRLFLLVRNTKLEIQDWQLQRDQAAQDAARRPTVADEAEAEAILASAEATDP